ncbi:MAG: prolipoprotein diacylglyceryl transferase [Patulibacter sp.]
MLASIPSPAESGISIGPLTLHAYGLSYVIGLAAAIWIGLKLWESRGGNRDLVFEAATWGFPAGIVGGRLYHVITSWNEIGDEWWAPFAIWEGGMGIWGGITVGVLVGWWRVHRAGADTALFADAAAPSILVAQAIGRVGNYFNQEIFGKPTDLPWGLEIDPANRPDGYEQFATFHPMFLYEGLWCLALAAILIVLYNRRTFRPPGLFALYVAGYSAFRIFAETQRLDPANEILGMRVNFWVAIVLVAVGLAAFWNSQRRPGGGDGRGGVARGATPARR